MSATRGLDAATIRHDLGGVLAALRTAKELMEGQTDAGELLVLSIERLERLIAELKKETSK